MSTSSNQEVVLPIQKRQIHTKNLPLQENFFSPPTYYPNMVLHSCGRKNCEIKRKRWCSHHVLGHDLFTYLNSAWNLSGKLKASLWPCAEKADFRRRGPTSLRHLPNKGRQPPACTRHTQTFPSNAFSTFLSSSRCHCLKAEFQQKSHSLPESRLSQDPGRRPAGA